MKSKFPWYLRGLGKWLTLRHFHWKENSWTGIEQIKQKLVTRKCTKISMVWIFISRWTNPFQGVPKAASPLFQKSSEDMSSCHTRCLIRYSNWRIGYGVWKEILPSPNYPKYVDQGRYLITTFNNPFRSLSLALTVSWVQISFQLYGCSFPHSLISIIILFRHCFKFELLKELKLESYKTQVAQKY